MKLLTQIEIARELGVSRGQVHMWTKRRERNGFPEPIEDGARPRYSRVAVLRWHKKYKPSQGGRPARSA